VTLLNITVTDSGSNTAGPDTYTITVNAASPLSIQTATLPGANEGWAYNSYIQASGGVQPYTWTITSGTAVLPLLGSPSPATPATTRGARKSPERRAAAEPRVSRFKSPIMWEYRQPAAQHRGYGLPEQQQAHRQLRDVDPGWSDSSQGEVLPGCGQLRSQRRRQHYGGNWRL